MVGGGVHWHGRAPLSGVVEAVLSGRGPEVSALAAQDHGAPQDTESTADPASVEGEAKRHHTLILVNADGEPDGRYDTAHSWKTSTDMIGPEEEVIRNKNLKIWILSIWVPVHP